MQQRLEVQRQRQGRAQGRVQEAQPVEVVLQQLEEAVACC